MIFTSSLLTIPKQYMSPAWRLRLHISVQEQNAEVIAHLKENYRSGNWHYRSINIEVISTFHCEIDWGGVWNTLAWTTSFSLANASYNKIKEEYRESS